MDFFKSGLITARLKSGGTTDLVSDAFMIVVISGTSSDEHCFSSHVGIGSSSQVLQGAIATSRSTSDSVIYSWYAATVDDICGTCSYR